MGFEGRYQAYARYAVLEAARLGDGSIHDNTVPGHAIALGHAEKNEEGDRGRSFMLHLCLRGQKVSLFYL